MFRFWERSEGSCGSVACRIHFIDIETCCIAYRIVAVAADVDIVVGTSARWICAFNVEIERPVGLSRHRDGFRCADGCDVIAVVAHVGATLCVAKVECRCLFFCFVLRCITFRQRTVDMGFVVGVDHRSVLVIVGHTLRSLLARVSLILSVVVSVEHNEVRIFSQCALQQFLAFRRYDTLRCRTDAVGVAKRDVESKEHGLQRVFGIDFS